MVFGLNIITIIDVSSEVPVIHNTYKIVIILYNGKNTYECTHLHGTQPYSHNIFVQIDTTSLHY